jgi:hypothetical protein
MVFDPQSYINQQSMLIPVVVVVVAIRSNRSSDCGSRICEVVFVMEAVLVALSTMPGSANFDFRIGCEQGEWKYPWYMHISDMEEDIPVARWHGTLKP